MENTDPAIQAYASSLHRMVTDAWRAAAEASDDQQEDTAQSAYRTTLTDVSFEVQDRVCRRLYDSINKLEWEWAGPYRVLEVLGDGNYKLGDLENNLICDRVHVSNLRHYLTKVDEVPLGEDELLVDLLMKRRLGASGSMEYLVKWRQHPRSQASWVGESELRRRCAELVDEYEIDHPRSARHPAHGTDSPPAVAPRRARVPVRDRSVPPAPSTRPTSRPIIESDALPCAARFSRGQWTYGRRMSTLRGLNMRWMLAKAFTPAELASEPFQQLRKEFLEDAHPIAAYMSEFLHHDFFAAARQG